MEFRTHGRTGRPLWSCGEHIATLQDAAQGGEGRTETPGLPWFLLTPHFPLEVHLDPAQTEAHGFPLPTPLQVFPCPACHRSFGKCCQWHSEEMKAHGALIYFPFLWTTETMLVISSSKIPVYFPQNFLTHILL